MFSALPLPTILFLALLLLVGALRLVELQISRRHQAQLVVRGAAKVSEPKFRWMVLLHTADLFGAGFEVLFFRRTFYPILAAVLFCFFLAALAVRWVVIRTLGPPLNAQVMPSTRRGV